MRVLVVDQDATLLEALVRALAGQFTIDILTNKSDCIDLLRKTEFEVLVACERLADGSGLELLGQVAKRAPDTLRVFAAERERLALLRGKLGPFNLFATLAYPIEPRKLLSTLVAAAEDLHSEGGSKPIEHIVLSSEPEPVPQQPPPPARPVPPQVRQRVSRHAAQAAAPAQTAPTAKAPTATKAPPAAAAPPARKAQPPRQPPRELTPPAPPSAPKPFAALDGAAEIAVAARASIHEPRGPATRTAFVAGAGVAVAVVGVVLAFRFLAGGHHQTRTASTVPVPTPPHYTQEVVDLVTGVESDFTRDDFRKAESDVQRLRSLAPDHPRLPFFQSLIAHHAGNRRAEPPTKVATVHAPTSVPVQPHKEPSGAVATRASSSHSADDNAEAARPQAKPPAPKAPEVAPPAPAPASPSPRAPSTSDEGTQFAAATTAIAAPRGPMTDAPPAAPAGGSTFSGRTVEDSNGAAAAVPTPAPTPNRHRLGSGEPPPVVAPAKLKRQVAPDYPQAAARQGLEGFAEVRFTVTAQGTVTDVSIVESTPPDVFDKAATDAVRRWRYDPRTVDGQPTETQLQVKLQFKLDSKK